MADENKWYITVKGDGSYSPSSGGSLRGGPNEVSEEVAREVAAAGLDWVIVSRKPVSLTESALRGPLTLEDIFPAAKEAELAQKDAEAEREAAADAARLKSPEPAEPAPLTDGPEPEKDAEPLPSSEDEVAAKLAGDDAAADSAAGDEEPPEHTCPHEDCDKHGYAYASADSLQRHLDTKHGEES